MKLFPILENIFSALNSEGVDYVVLRDYENPEIMNHSVDLDVSFSEAHRAKAIEVLLKEGWLMPAINPNTYSHTNFFKWDGEKVYKIDVMWGLYFKNGQYEYTDKSVMYNNTLSTYGPKVPDELSGLAFLLLHVIFDKNDISDKNYNQLVKHYELLGEESQHTLVQITGIIIKTDDRKLLNKADYQKILIAEGYVKERNNFIWKLHHRLNFIKWSRLTKQMSVTVLGVDGTGKSSIISVLDDSFGKDSHVCYMGFRSYETKFAQQMMKPRNQSTETGKQCGTANENVNIYANNSSLINSVKEILKQPIRWVRWYALYREMKFRYNRAIKTNAPIVIFDRYSWEANDNARDWKERIPTYLFFRLFFPNPDMTIYLHCPAEISLQRKDDILDAKQFEAMKARFDKRYLNEKSLCIDTHANTPDQERGIVLEYIAYKSCGRYRFVPQK